MSNLMQKLLKNTPSLRLISSLSHQNLPKPYFPSIPRSTVHPVEQNPDPFINPVILGNAERDESLKFFPSFPFGYSLDPISFPVSGVSEVTESEDSVSEDSGTIYADSVKKKRKKKMNKHKYNKLRKLLRRKT
ncbi:PREDICTED: uncharacterized protein LOC109117150 [Tarenaya hassleriana]|uniref:uncharacterized protein LOC109117150 n=1 Tax=Tarenaya hassleriana TaxID=28532 RepID=UPI0008FD5611|nr:PREDICTED: uncharacterized protein LOC109117150 [Tarenaya hassleriana]